MTSNDPLILLDTDFNMPCGELLFSFSGEMSFYCTMTAGHSEDHVFTIEFSDGSFITYGKKVKPESK